MNITFGIPVGPSVSWTMIETLISRLHFQRIPEYEIILIGKGIPDPRIAIGGTGAEKVRVIDFDDNLKPGWITKKKNIIAAEAKYENLCIVHDYYSIPNYWYSCLLSYWEKEWDILCCQVQTYGTAERSADWLVNPEILADFIKDRPWAVEALMNAAPHENHPKYVNSLPYGVQDLWHIQYVSGGYILCKTDLLRTVPMNENMIWGDAPGEDVEWSERVIAAGGTIKFNPLQLVNVPNKKWKVTVMPNEVVEALREHYGSRPL